MLLIIASELGSTGRREMSSFHGLVTGKICIAETTASALVVLNRIALVTTGDGPRMRPSWLMRSANNGAVKTTKLKNPAAATRFTMVRTIPSRDEKQKGGQRVR